jgi:hypothetical protein
MSRRKAFRDITSVKINQENQEQGSDSDSDGSLETQFKTTRFQPNTTYTDIRTIRVRLHRAAQTSQKKRTYKH